jgi:hypothetical protein
MSFVERLNLARAELAQRTADPFRRKLEAAVRGKDAISTAALLDLLDVPQTTGNARRVGTTMRSLGFVPIKSRKLVPGGFRDTVARGWARPIREHSSLTDSATRTLRLGSVAVERERATP